MVQTLLDQGSWAIHERSRGAIVQRPGGPKLSVDHDDQTCSFHRPYDFLFCSVVIVKTSTDGGSWPNSQKLKLVLFEI
jgi:hypothetical protein